jgi:uncharacterized membrane protein YfcA
MALAYLSYPDPINGLFVLFLFVCLVSGLAMSAVGVGGVLLVPTLLVIGVPAKVAVSAVLCACMFSGAYSTYLYNKRGSLPWRLCFLVSLTVAPSAFVAALLMVWIPSVYLKVLICIICTSSGVQSIYQNFKKFKESKSKQPGPAARGGNDAEASDNSADPNKVVVGIPAKGTAPEEGGGMDYETRPLCFNWDYFLIGIFVGFGSVWTGTTGPVFLFPCLFLCKPNIKATDALGLGNFIAMPISICSTLFSIADVNSTVDIYLALIIAFFLLLTNPLGVWIAHKVDPIKLKMSISFMLLGVGITTLARLIVG